MERSHWCQQLVISLLTRMRTSYWCALWYKMAASNNLTDDLALFAVYNYYENKKKHKRAERKEWVKSWISERGILGAYHTLISSLQATDQQAYKNFLRLDVGSFHELVQLVSPLISKQDTSMRLAISAEEKLAVTLRYLATGRTITVPVGLANILENTLQR